MENLSQFNRSAAQGVQARFDAGLRSYMLGIYRNMGLGLGLTGLVALGVASSPALVALIFGTPLKWVAMLAPLAFVFFFTFRIDRMSAASARWSAARASTCTIRSARNCASAGSAGGR